MKLFKKKSADLANGETEQSSPVVVAPNTEVTGHKKTLTIKSLAIIACCVGVLLVVAIAVIARELVNKKSKQQEIAQIKKSIDSSFKAGDREGVVKQYNELYKEQAIPQDKAATAQSLSGYYYPNDIDSAIKWAQTSVDMYNQAGNKQKAGDMQDILNRMNAYKERQKAPKEENNGRDSQL